jgi:Protein of unknown function (DUF2490)
LTLNGTTLKSSIHAAQTSDGQRSDVSDVYMAQVFILNRKLTRALLLAFALLGLPRRAAAHPQDLEGWFVTAIHISFEETKTYQVYLEGQPRIGNDWRRAATFQGRAALVYNVDKSLGFYAGYAWTPSLYDSNYHRDYRDEQRLWQQVIYRHGLFGIQWQHRLIEEQRFITRTNGVSNRTRYLLRGSYALTARKDFGLTGYDELMVNLNGVNNGPWAGYDRNRVFFGPYWQIDNARYEVGYLGEHLKRFGSDERWAHVLLVSASFNF